MKENTDYYLREQQFSLLVSDFIQNNKDCKPSQEIIDRFIEEIKVLERFAVGKRYFMLLDHTQFFPLYFSDSIVQDGGYTFEEIAKQGLFFLFKKVHWRQLSLTYKVHTWGNRFQSLVGYHIPADCYQVWCCGLKLRDKWNRWRVIMIKQKMLITNEKNQAVLSFLELEEVTHIYTANFAWYRATCTYEGQKITRAYFSNGSKKEYPDLLSTREIEILQLASTQKNNQEIAALLGISKNTVERHRKNMIAKVGVKDMTALIQIGQMVQLI